MYLFSATEFKQFFKLNSFIDHFHEHQSLNHSLSLLEFLNIHYGHAHVHDEDYEKDMKLPFKTTSNDFSSFQTVLNYGISYLPLVVNDLYVPKKFITVDCYLIPSYLSAIWQPPKIVLA